tara:strand:- start:127 stop:867 length:741 start_codon:yes stop_codon:yes gene_type:complete
MKIVAAIPARLNSSRLPKKLLRDICGKTLITRTYEATVNSNLFDDVLVITNSSEIIAELESSKVKYIFDDENYQTGTDRIAGVASKIEADIIINVQGDEPFINSNTIESILNTFKHDKENNIKIVSVMTPIKDGHELKNPNNVKVFTDESNNAIYFSRHPIPFKIDLNISKAHKHVGIYAFRKKSLIEFAKLKVGELESSEKIEALRLIENDIKIKMINSNDTFIGIDTEEDIQKAIKIFCEKGNL